MQQPQTLTTAVPSLGDRIENLPLELRREIMSFFLPASLDRQRFPWAGACAGNVKYYAFTTGLAPRTISRTICDDFEDEVTKFFRNKPITMVMRINRGDSPHGMTGLLAHLCEPEDASSAERRVARHCVKTWWGLLLAILVDMAAAKGSHVCSKFGFDPVAVDTILEDVKDIVLLRLLQYHPGIPGSWRTDSWAFLRVFVLSAYPQFLSEGKIELHLQVPDWDAYETSHLYAFLRDVRYFTENGLLRLRVLVFTMGATIDDWMKGLRKVARAVEWVEGTMRD